MDSISAGLDNNESLPRMNLKAPLHAITKQASVLRGNQRLKSSREVFHANRSQTANLSNNKQMDNQFVPATRVNTRSCVLCRGQKHSQYSCEMITNNFNCRPLGKNDVSARNALAMSIVNVKGLPLFPRCISDKRTIFDDCPRKQKALVIHKRFIITPEIYLCEDPSNICIECTFLGDGGYPTPEYHRALFKVASVASYVQKSKTNCVASQIH